MVVELGGRSNGGCRLGSEKGGGRLEVRWVRDNGGG